MIAEGEAVLSDLASECLGLALVEQRGGATGEVESGVGAVLQHTCGALGTRLLHATHTHRKNDPR